MSKKINTTIGEIRTATGLERRCEIDAKIVKLRAKYQENGTFDWNSLSKDHNIWYYETTKAIVPVAFRTNLSVPKWYLFNYPSWFLSTTEHCKAHEFGHALLDGGNEEEAIYFAENLTGIKEKEPLHLRIALLFERFARFSGYPGDPTDPSAQRIYSWILHDFAKNNLPIHPTNISEEELACSLYESIPKGE